MTHLNTIRGTQGMHVEVGKIITLAEISDFDKKVLSLLHQMVDEREEILSYRHELNPFYKRFPGDTAVRAVDLRDRIHCSATSISRSILKMSNLWHEPIFEGKRGTYTVYGV